MLDYHPKSEPLMVISPGGMACTFVLQCLRRLGFFTNCPRDSDGLKHCPEPAHSKVTKFRAVRKLYIWNDPLFAILSLHRRGWLRIQQRKLKGDGGPFPENLESLWRQTTAAGHDITGIARHFEQWFEDKSSGIFWLDFRHIAIQRLEFAEFLGCSLKEMQDLQFSSRYSTMLPGIPKDVLALYDRLDKQVCLRMLQRQRTTDATNTNLVCKARDCQTPNS